MFAFLLIVCTPVHYGMQCLPVQPYKDAATCVTVGNSYLRTANEAAGWGQRPAKARCVRIAK